MAPNPVLGIILHAIGGFSSASFYVPVHKIKQWAWETYWISLGFVSWVIMPQIGSWTTWDWSKLSPTSNPWHVIAGADPKTIFWTYFFGCLWGFGGLTCGMSLRFLGLSLGQSLTLGFCAAFGTIIPPVFAGNAATLFTTKSGLVVMAGVMLCLFGIAVCGYAGALKEKLLTDEQKKASIKEFALTKGIIFATVGGIMSACMAFAFEAGKPIAEAAVAAGAPDVFKNNTVLILGLGGGFTTNFFASIIMHARNKTFGDFTRRPAAILASNYFWSILSGMMWYGQFFFYGMGTTKMGKYDFTSWSLHMAFVIIFSNFWGIALNEWKAVGKLTWTVLMIGILILIISTVLIGWGNHLAAVGT